MTDQNEKIQGRGDSILRAIEEGLQQTRELLGENQLLRNELEKRESELAQLRQLVSSNESLASMQAEMAALLEARAQSETRLTELERENEHFAARYLEIEDENNNLANLYIASFQLHSTLEFEEVLRNILEIVINLVGAEEFGVYLRNPEATNLHAVGSEGVRLDQLPDIELDGSDLGRAIARGTLMIREGFVLDDSVKYDRPIAAIPLKMKDELIGAILIYRMLAQKEAFSDVDRELFSLLAGHAATALFAARLYGDSRRKLSTIQGFLDMLKQ